MGIAHITAILAISLTGLLPSSCSKTHPADAKADVAAVPVNVRNLGELSLTNHCETRVQLGAGKSCTITPKVVDRSNVRLTLTMESKKADGHTDGLIVTEVIVSQGKPFEVTIDGLDISLTPDVLAK
jgi:hypothetical protein